AMRRAIESALIIAAAAAAATPFPRALVERTYARGVYAAIQPRLTAVSNLVSVPLLDVALTAIVAALAWMWWRRLRLRRESGGTLQTLARLLMDTAAVAAVVYFWFLLAWGLNYQREPLRSVLDFHDDRITTEALRQLAGRDVDGLNSLYAAAWSEPWPLLAEQTSTLDTPFAAVQRDLALGWRVRPARP